MGALIRSAEAAARVRAAPPPERPQDRLVAQADLERETRIREREALEARLEAQEAQLADLRKEVEAAFERGREEGRAEGRKDADDGKERALALISGGVEGALDILDGHLAEFDRLAVLLARTAVERIVGDATQYAVLVPEIVRQQMARLAAQTVLRLEVSAEDFPDPEALAELAAAAGRPQLEIVALPELKNGDCRVILQLGAVQAGADAQWAKLRALFDETLSIGESS